MERVRPRNFFCVSKSSPDYRTGPGTSQFMSPQIVLLNKTMDGMELLPGTLHNTYLRFDISRYKTPALPPANLPSSSLLCLPQPTSSLLIQLQALIHCDDQSSGPNRLIPGLLPPGLSTPCPQTDRHTPAKILPGQTLLLFYGVTYQSAGHLASPTC